MLIEVFKLVPFRPRLKAIMFVCKSFQGLIREKSLWKCVETDNALVGPTLAYMIQPVAGTTVVEPLIPRANVEGVAVDMAYVGLRSVFFFPLWKGRVSLSCAEADWGKR